MNFSKFRGRQTGEVVNASSFKNLQKAVNRIISDEGLEFTYATIDTSTLNMGVEVNEFDFIVEVFTKN